MKCRSRAARWLGARTRQCAFRAPRLHQERMRPRAPIVLYAHSVPSIYTVARLPDHVNPPVYSPSPAIAQKDEEEERRFVFIFLRCSVLPSARAGLPCLQTNTSVIATMSSSSALRCPSAQAASGPQHHALQQQQRQRLRQRPDASAAAGTQRTGTQRVGTQPTGTQRIGTQRVGTQRTPPENNDRKAVRYGSDWYAATREAAKPSTMREEIARRKAVNDVAYRDRRLNSDAWEGSEYKGSRWNILTFLAALFVLVPVLGLGFAYQTYGVLWG